MSPAASCTSPATLAACFLASPKARLKSEFWVWVSGMGCSLEKRCHATTPQPPKRFGNRNVYGVAGLFRQPIPATEGRDMDDPKRQQPEIPPPPPPMPEPQRGLPEIPPGIDPPEKSSPTTGEN